MEGAHDVMHMYISNVGQKLNGVPRRVYSRVIYRAAERAGNSSPTNLLYEYTSTLYVVVLKLTFQHFNITTTSITNTTLLGPA